MRTNDAASAKILTTEQLGPKQSLTPEGFLLCLDVPIARIGVMDYAAIELPDLEDKDGVIEVERNADVLFSPATLSSFEGKPVCIDHPYEAVGPRNWSIFAKGSMKNVRRGEGDQSNLMLADLLITDAEAIRRVRSKELTETSNGYDAEYEQIAPGRARQTSIVGNHVALVKNARCGSVCSVQDSSKVLLGDEPMAVKKGVSLADKLRKLFMTKDSEGFEKALEEVKDEDGMEKNVPDIHIHMAGAEKVGGDETNDDGGEADPMAKVMAAIDGVAKSVSAIAERVSKLESGQTTDSGAVKGGETEDDDGDDDGDGTMDSDDGQDDKKSTNDSTALRDEFQDAKTRAEILAPGVKLPTFDAKAASKKTADSICVLRRRALRAALDNDNAGIVKSVLGRADVSKMTCDAAAMAFNAASEMVKAKNKGVGARTNDSQHAEKKDINQVHAEFWAKYKA